jgi:hypothetical protein
VAPNAGGIPNLLSHGATGFLYRPGDLPGVVRLTQAVLTDADLRIRVGQAARQAIEARDWEQSVGRVRHVYTEAIRSRPRHAAPWTWRDRLAQTTTFALVSAFRSVPRKRERVWPPPPNGHRQGQALRTAEAQPAALV